jgi:hypothetical protein
LLPRHWCGGFCPVCSKENGFCFKCGHEYVHLDYCEECGAYVGHDYDPY